jgi:hypothetical protein
MCMISFLDTAVSNNLCVSTTLSLHDFEMLGTVNTKLTYSGIINNSAHSVNYPQVNVDAVVHN